MSNLTLNMVHEKRATLLKSREEYEEEGALAEFQYNLNCLSKAERLIKAGETVSEDELWDLY